MGFCVLLISVSGQCESLGRGISRVQIPTSFLYINISESEESIGEKNIFAMKKQNDDELQSRREFFRNAAKAALPILGAIVLSNVPMLSQAQNEETELGCDWMCTGGCKGGCGRVCSVGCTNSCSGSCDGACKGGCYGSCKGTCSGSSRGYY